MNKNKIKTIPGDDSIPFYEHVPECLCENARWCEVWREWVDYRNQKKPKGIGKPLTERGAKIVLGKMVKAGPRAAWVAMLRGIESGWTGVFLEDAAETSESQAVDPGELA